MCLFKSNLLLGFFNEGFNLGGFESKHLILYCAFSNTKNMLPYSQEIVWCCLLILFCFVLKKRFGLAYFRIWFGFKFVVCGAVFWLEDTPAAQTSLFTQFFV